MLMGVEFLFIGAIALNLYAAVLVVLRAVVYRTKLYRPMLLNICLSIAPLLVLALAFAAIFLLFPLHRTVGLVALGVVAVAWLLMLPNASYLITELNQSHRREDDPVPLWYDIILVITLAMSGVVNTVVNVFIAQVVFTLFMYDDQALSLFKPASILMLCVVLLLVSLGMYLGRYLRLNSWDVRHPFSLIRKVFTHFIKPGNILACFGFTITYAIFIGIIYLTIITPIVYGMHQLEVARY